jgi:hypothetical protein
MLMRLFCTALIFYTPQILQAQKIPLPARYRQEHPRQQAGAVDRGAIDPYVIRHRTDSTWIVSRLQLYWTTRSSTVYIKGGVYDHAEGQAPVPTVRFPGARDHVTVYGAPKLEDLLPYSDDARGVWLVNRSKPGQPLEWAPIGKTGRIIESINNSIMALAYQASQVYSLSNDVQYARFAFDLFDTYMTGLYYREIPKDLAHGHHETIAGLTTFEVIQETPMINHLTGIYDFLYNYIQQRAPGKITKYADVFRKWARVQINQGVAFNNWNLIEARNILSIASILEDDAHYADKQGRQYFINFVLNENAERQWSIAKLLEEGYDAKTGLWNECPGYSLNVLGDFTGLVARFDQQFNHDLLQGMPVIEKAVTAAAQYLFPNGFYAAFGDSHYGRLSTTPAKQLLAHAQLHGKRALADSLSQYIRAIETSNVQDYISPVFSSPHVSYFALRNGFDSTNGLMVALSGSKGNHMHAGGISMELYGKGLVLAPESGIGTSYFQPDYGEYYSQFPAHNTVAVDGISAYPVMKSNHAFEVKACYPAAGVQTGYFPKVSFGNLYFLEPETQSDQNRLIAIVRTSDSTGYYVDVFRSRRQDGKDKMHDYFYHNMGQQLTIQSHMQPTNKLTFGGGHLHAYDYFSNKRSVTTANDVQATFELSMPGRPSIQMNMWMKGETDREIFAVDAPKSKAIDRMGLPAEIVELPLPTIVARQSGEAWKRPFVAVFEPSTSAQPKSISSIESFDKGLIVRGKAGDQQTILIDTTGTFSVISEKAGKLEYLFLGNGSSISHGGYAINASSSNTTAVLAYEQGIWYFTSTQPVVLTLPNGKRLSLPATPYTSIKF